jgi:hypothetical protein
MRFQGTDEGHLEDDGLQVKHSTETFWKLVLFVGVENIAWYLVLWAKGANNTRILFCSHKKSNCIHEENESRLNWVIFATLQLRIACFPVCYLKLFFYLFLYECEGKEIHVLPSASSSLTPSHHSAAAVSCVGRTKQLHVSSEICGDRTYNGLNLSEVRSQSGWRWRGWSKGLGSKYGTHNIKKRIWHLRLKYASKYHANNKERAAQFLNGRYLFSWSRYFELSSPSISKSKAKLFWQQAVEAYRVVKC